MAFLARAKKEDLIYLAQELGEIVSAEYRIIDLKKIIIQSEDYEEDFVRDMLESIVNSRKCKEEREDKEREREMIEKESEREREMIEKEREREMIEKEREREMYEKEKEREFELEKLRIQAVNPNLARDFSELNISDVIRTRKPYELHKLMQKFDSKEGDISLYLILFERQARRAQIPETEWVSNLLCLLPYEITQLIAREPDEQAEDYAYVKNLLLKRFKLSSEKFRQKFTQHQRTGESSWRDYVFELKNYFEEWLEGLKIDDYEKLKDLMITDQLKRRVPAEIREHFIDEWTKFVKSSELAERLDEYESIRGNKKRHVPFENHN